MCVGSCSVLVRAARCPSRCDTARTTRGNLLLAFGSFNFHKHLEGGGHRSKCVLGRAACSFVRRVVRRGVTRRLLLDFGSFNFHKHLEGGNRSKCVLVVQRAGSSGALFVVV